MSTPQYNRVIRKLVVGFGNLFNEISLVRYNPDLSEAERFLIPIAYATKERYVMRLEDDYTLDKKVQVALPRLSFEMTGLSYDSSRKQNTNIKNFAQTSTGVVAQYNPVPYNFDFSLYLYVRNIEDATQVLEHIIPYFTPDYTIKLNLIPEMGIVKEIPVILNTTFHEIIYEGDRDQETRMIIWTLNFTVKGFIFGKSSTTGIIKTSITNILNDIGPDDVVTFNMSAAGVGSYQAGETVYQGYTAASPTASGKVISWNNNILRLTNINGNFISSQPVYGVNNNASYTFTSYQIQPQKYAQIIAVTNPTDANGNVSYTYTNVIQETPNTTSVITSANFSGDMQGNIFGVDDLSNQLENPIDLLGS
jgi:hypothetical protein